MKAKASLVAVATGLLLTFFSGTASAKPVTATFHEKGGTDTFHDIIPCLEAAATITTTENGVFHVTAAGVDDHGTPADPTDDTFVPPYHVTGTFTGTVEAIPDDPSLPSFTGHFTQWFGENSNQRNFAATFTFTVIVVGSDGSTLRFHETDHFSVTPQGAILKFEKPKCF